ncbi:hypothetical protein ACFQ1M_12120 [Sungkyunkwania multivorans]|uniref:Uncharacterized protein n=1 Tax=Sungkyunkwania multivorans TaxID=1173618 RepID=A0ABW3D1F9_9FLAO
MSKNNPFKQIQSEKSLPKDLKKGILQEIEEIVLRNEEDENRNTPSITSNKDKNSHTPR